MFKGSQSSLLVRRSFQKASWCSRLRSRTAPPSRPLLAGTPQNCWSRLRSSANCWVRNLVRSSTQMALPKELPNTWLKVWRRTWSFGRLHRKLNKDLPKRLEHQQLLVVTMHHCPVKKHLMFLLHFLQQPLHRLRPPNKDCKEQLSK